MKRLVTSIVSALAVLAVPVSAQAAQVLVLGDFEPHGLNAKDQIVGNVGDGSGNFSHAGVWRNGVITPLPELAGSSSSDAYAINVSGRVAGDDSVGANGAVPVFWDVPSGGATVPGPTTIALPGAAGNPGSADAVDSAGDMVGTQATTTGQAGFERFASGAVAKVGQPDIDPDPNSTNTTYANAITPDGATILGSVQSYLNSTPTSYNSTYLFPGLNPSASGTKLDLSQVGGHFPNALASDGSVVGYKASGSSLANYLRLPASITDTPVSLGDANAVNAKHVVVGDIAVGSNQIHAAIWQNGTITDLNTMLPAGSGLELLSADGINDNGDIIGAAAKGGKEVGFLLKLGYVVDASGDQPDKDTTDGACLTSAGTCTLRAALQQANATGSAAPVSITFNIPGVPAGTLATVSPQSPLPAATAPVQLDGTGQPGALVDGPRKIGVIIDGASAGASADGLQLSHGAAGSSIDGLQVQNFADVGVVMGDSNEQVAGSVLTGDGSGVEVAGDGAIVGAGNDLPGDIFFRDGSVAKAVAYIRSHGGQQLSTGQVTQSQIGFGAGILMDRSSAGTRISDDAIGVHGASFSAPPDQLGPDGFGAATTAQVNLGNAPDASPFGVLIAATGGAQIRHVTLTGNNVFGSTLFGLSAGTDSSSSVSGLSVAGASFGTEPDGSALTPLGLGFGLTAAGNVTGLTVGSPGAGNRFTSSLVGLLLSGTGLASPVVQSNSFGSNQALNSLADLSKTNLLAVVLADVQGAQIGGSGPGQGNQVLSSVFGVTLAGTKNANDTIAANTIGATSPVSFDPKEGLPDLYGVVGIGDLVSGAPGQSQSTGIKILGNTIQGEGLGTFLTGATGVTMQSNTIGGAVAGALVVSASRSAITGNVFENSGFGLLLAGADPTPSENAAAGTNPGQDSSASRAAYLTQPNEDVALDAVNETSTADLTAASLAAPGSPPPSNADLITGNRFGVDAAGHPAPNGLPVTIAGTSRALQFGGLGAGQGNLVLDNRAAGLLLIGNGANSPQAQVLGNTIYNNENFTLTSATGLAGLGLDLWGGRPGFGNGVNAQDPVQPDSGPDNLQNSPVLDGATTSGGHLTVTGTLHGARSTRYLVELYADQNQNPFGAGEGETLLARPTLTTDGSGNGRFTTAVPAPNASFRYVSATATTQPAGTLGVTSEFSRNAAIHPAGSTTVSASGGSVTTGSQNVTLPIQVSCASAPSSTCTVSSTATTSATGTAQDLAAVSSRARPRRRPAKSHTLLVGRGKLTVRAGKRGKVKLTLTRAGFARLRSHRALRIKVLITVSGRARKTIKRTVTLTLRYRAPKPKPKRRR